MKLHKSILLAPVAVLSLSSCAIIRQRLPINEDTYIIKYDNLHAHDYMPLDEDGDFNILQLSDLHMSAMDDAPLHFAFMKKTIDEAKYILEHDENGPRHLHLIVISGDVFTFSTRDTVKELCNFFESQKIPWTLTFGNHDEQGYYPIDWLTSYLTDLSSKFESNLLFRDFPNDDVFGSANFVIDLPRYSQDNQSRQIIMLDSNRYNYGEGYGYDYIHGDQIDWYLRAYEAIRLEYQKSYGDREPNSLAFFHIPVPEYLDAYNDARNPKDPSHPNSTFLKSNVYTYENNTWNKKEAVTRDVHIDSSEGSPEVNTGFFETVQDLGYTKGFFVGHAHMNNNCMDYKLNVNDQNSVALCYGIKSTDRVYMDESLLGGQLIRYKSSSKVGDDEHKGSAWFDTDLIYHKYTDLKEGE